MSSPLADFLSRLQEDGTLSTNVPVVSDNARAWTPVVAHTVNSHKSPKRSRWGQGKEKNKRSLEVPARGLSPYLPTAYIYKQRTDVPFPAL
jgi:hypothetical protein